MADTVTEASPALVLAKNQTALSRAVGRERKTIQRWRREPGFPDPRPNGSYDVNEVKAWMSDNNKDAEVESSTTETLTEKRSRLIDQQRKKLEIQNAILRKQYFPIEEGRRAVGEMIANAKRILLPGPSALAPQVIGVSAPEAEKLIRDWLVEAMGQLSEHPFGE